MASDADRRPIDPAVIAEAFGRAVPTYDQAAFSFFTPFAELLVATAGVSAGDRVLDVACGTGAVASGSAGGRAPMVV